MRVLFLKLRHIGDLLLLTPTLAALKAAEPRAEAWVLARRGTEGILAGCPHVDRVVLDAAPEADQRGSGGLGASLALVRLLRSQNFDHAIELGDNARGRWTALCSGARERAASGWNPRLGKLWRGKFHHLADFDWWTAHRVEKDFRTAAAALPFLRDREPGPLVFSPERRAAPPDGLMPPAGEPYAVIHAATRWPRKAWPGVRWVEVGRHLAARGLRLLVSSGPADAERAEATSLAASIGPAARATGGRLPWPQLAGLLGGACLFAGVDTAAMHLAAACQVPAVGVFGPSVEWQWSPWKCPHRVCAPPAPPADLPPLRRLQLAEQRAIADVPVAAVIEACEELLAARPA